MKNNKQKELSALTPIIRDFPDISIVELPKKNSLNCWEIMRYYNHFIETVIFPNKVDYNIYYQGKDGKLNFLKSCYSFDKVLLIINYR